MKRVFVSATVFAGLMLAPASPIAAADPVGDFFHRLGNTLAKPFRSKPDQSQRKAKKPRRGEPSPAEPAVITPTPEPGTETLLASPTAAPTPQIRVALPAPEDPTGRRDVPYGVPVRGQPGFVQSPFAPNRGLVDVRAFATGAPVQDPYTGKVFLTP